MFGNAQSASGAWNPAAAQCQSSNLDLELNALVYIHGHAELWFNNTFANPAAGRLAARLRQNLPSLSTMIEWRGCCGDPAVPPAYIEQIAGAVPMSNASAAAGELIVVDGWRLVQAAVAGTYHWRWEFSWYDGGAATADVAYLQNQRIEIFEIATS
ncbi:MAG: hypothetical protein P8Y25_00720 [Chromatiaceae bacterium]